MQEQIETQNEQIDLNEQEQERLDQLLTSARNFHYISFILTGLSLAMLSIDNPKGISLPIFSFELPSIQASVAIYFIALIMAMLTDILFSMAYPWMEIDMRRPPFAWFALGHNISYKRTTLWIILPAFLCGIFSSFHLKGDYVGMGLIYSSVGVIFLPRGIRMYRDLINSKKDHRGGPATFSIYLLHWHRLIRQTIMTFAFLLAVFAAIPKWWNGLVPIFLFLLILFGVGYAVRVIGGIPFMYRWIDKLGKKHGFPIESRHYK